jgi:PAS domain S-box-containing protein
MRSEGSTRLTKADAEASISSSIRPSLPVRSDHAAEDIGTLKTENRALRAEAERTRRVLDSAADYAIITLDLKGRITGWNEGARTILGYLEAEALGRSGEMLFSAEDRDKGVFLTELCQAIEEGRATNERWHLRRNGTRFWASGVMMPLLNENGQPEGFLNILRDNTVLQAEEERRALVLAEMGHRMKNVLATVQAVASQTLRNAGVPEALQETLEHRLVALARSHDLLTRGGWAGASLTDIVQRALSPYGGDSRLTVRGLPVWLETEAVEMLNLAFHELATNAAKHGALSVPEGRVGVSWTLRRTDRGMPLVEIDWRERGGPPVMPPKRQGFGSRLLEHGLVQKFGGTVTLDFGPEGLECRICLPVSTGGEE